MDAPPVREGDILAGKYRVDRVLGTGGMGVVVAATHVDLREPYALKFMRATELSDDEAVERFLREARACSRLRGEHVAKVYDVGRLADGAPYMVMEFLSGKDLRAVLKERGPLPLGEAMLYLLQACEALAEAHAHNIVHRDLKPANLFLTQRADRTACVKVLDFGISKILGDYGEGHSVTKSYAMLGSPYYMSPEQMRSSRDVDARTDVWSLGVIAYQLVSGEVPFNGRTITEIISHVLQGSPAPPSSAHPGLPPALDAAILKCLEADLGRRHANVAELAAALAPFAPPEGHRSLDAVVRLLAVDVPVPPAPPPSEPLLLAPPGLGEDEPSVAPGPAEPGPRAGESPLRAALAWIAASPAGLPLAGAVLGVALGITAYELTGGAPAPSPEAAVPSSTVPSASTSASAATVPMARPGSTSP